MSSDFTPPLPPSSPPHTPGHRSPRPSALPTLSWPDPKPRESGLSEHACIPEGGGSSPVGATTAAGGSSQAPALWASLPPSHPYSLFFLQQFPTPLEPSIRNSPQLVTVLLRPHSPSPLSLAASPSPGSRFGWSSLSFEFQNQSRKPSMSTWDLGRGQQPQKSCGCLWLLTAPQALPSAELGSLPSRAKR